MALVNAFEAIATEATLAQIEAKLPAVLNGLPTSATQAQPVVQIPAKTWRSGFDKVIASPGVDSAWFTLVQNGAGQTVAQTGGSLVITSGTTANSETIIRSVETFRNNHNLRYSATLSQRIANNNFYIELVDVIADAAAYTINSATSVTVTIPANPFTAANVGQSMYLGAITGAAGIPGRYAIASVTGNTVTFTVAAWPATGTGTVHLFGWNYEHIIYNGTTATTTQFDMQRNGWATGETTVNINTTATGHVGTIASASGTGVYLDQTGLSATALELTQRASRVRNIPDDEVNLRVQIRAHNGTSAPATSTTFTVGFAEVDNFISQSVSISNIAPQSLNTALAVQIANTPAVTLASTVVSGTATVTPATGTNYAVTTTAAALAAVIKASAGNLYELTVSNITAATIYVKLYNKATVGLPASDVPVITIPVVAGAVANIEFGAIGKRFAAGIAVGATAAAAATDTTAVTAGAVISATYL